MTNLLLSASLAISVGSAFARAPPGAIPPATVLTVDVGDVRSDAGTLVFALYDDPDAFPGEFARAAYVKKVAARRGRATVTFDGFAPGKYAVVVFHDEDGDGEVKKNFVGMPKEGIGASNFTGLRPSFRESAIELTGAEHSVTVELRYL